VHIDLGGPDYWNTFCAGSALPRVCEYTFTERAGATPEPRTVCDRMAFAVEEHERAATGAGAL
jgi:hypothetical protein